MRVFISEYVCGGGWAEGVPPASLLCEGRSMLQAIAADAAAIAGCSVVTTWDSRLGEPRIDGVAIIRTHGLADEQQTFERLAGEYDLTLVIAPEFDGTLLARRQIVDRAGGRFAGPEADAIALCSDKLRLAGHLQGRGIPTIPTALLDGPAAASAEFPLVVKPRDGAGSQRTFLVRDADELHRARSSFELVRESGAPIVQPYVRGRALSIAVVVSGESLSEGHRVAGSEFWGRPGSTCVEALGQGHRFRSDPATPTLRRDSRCGAVEMFAVAEQGLSDDGLFQYLGGCIPADLDATARERTADIVRRTCACIPGLNGYVGFDVILPEGADAEPLIVEVNPRLTTSYLGYRALAEENLAERILMPGGRSGPIRWKPAAEVRFTPDGPVERERYSATS